MILTFLRNFRGIQTKIKRPLLTDGLIITRKTIRSLFVQSTSLPPDLTMTTRPRFIIDTDCGLDDAQAILMALSQGVDVVGITTCSGNTGVDQVCKNVLRVLKLANRLEIPVYKGTSASLLRDTPACTAYHGKDGLGDVPDPEAPDSSLVKEEHAVNALVRMINQNAGEVTLVCLGPLTNIALAIQMDPTIGSKVKECHIMGGNYEAKGNITVCSEFNFRADPEAANIVLNQLGCPVTLVCWELCLKYSLTWDYYDNLVGSGSQAGHFIKTCEKNITAKMRQEDSMETYICADQFSMVTAMDSSVAMETLNCFATVELHGEFSRGQLVLDHSGMLGHKPNEEYNKLRSPGTKKAKFLHAVEKVLVKFSLDTNWPYLPCDELCMATAIDTNIVTKRELVYSTVELAGKYTRGQMVVDWSGTLNNCPNVNLVLEIDRRKYFDLMKQTVQ